jgi:hypothetical protein
MTFEGILPGKAVERLGRRPHIVTTEDVTGVVGIQKLAGVSHRIAPRLAIMRHHLMRMRH